MSNDKDKEKFDKLLDKLHKSTEALAGAIVSNPLGKIEELQIEIDDFDEDDEVNENIESEDIRESNRKNIFEITNNEGRVIYLSIERVKSRIQNRLPKWTEYKKKSGTIVDGLLISTKNKFRDKIDKLVRKLEDGDLKFPIKLKTLGGHIELDAKKLREIDRAIQNHVSYCEDLERQIWEAIANSNRIDEIADILVNNRIRL